MTHVEQERCETSRHKKHRSSTGSESWIQGIRDRNGRAASREFVSSSHSVSSPLSASHRAYGLAGASKTGSIVMDVLKHQKPRGHVLASLEGVQEISVGTTS